MSDERSGRSSNSFPDSSEVKTRTSVEELFSDPQNVKKLEVLLERLDSLNYLLERLELFIGAGMLDELFGLFFSIMAFERAFMKEESLQGLSELLGRLAFLASPKCMEELSEALDKDERLGLMGLMNKLRDPEVQRGLGVVMNALKVVGKCADECGSFK